MATNAAKNNRKAEANTVRYEPDSEGLRQFLSDFKVIWNLFKSLADIFSSTSVTRELEGRKTKLQNFAKGALNEGAEGYESNMGRTIGFGVRLMKEVELFLADWLENESANLRFDGVIKKIRENSEAVWEERKGDIFSAREAFTAANSKDHNYDDFLQAIKECAHTERLLMSVLHEAERTAESERLAREAEERRRANERAREKVKSLIDELD